MREEDSYLELPLWAFRHPRFAPVRGVHFIPTVGILHHRKHWYSAKIHVRYCPADEPECRTLTDCRTFDTEWDTLFDIICADTVGEARVLISLCLADAS
jgi:hypothetical protein